MYYKEQLNEKNIPSLLEWTATVEDQIFSFDPASASVIGHYDTILGLKRDYRLSIFDIKKRHYNQKMNDILFHINYFEKYFDPEHDLYAGILRVKYIVDTHPNLEVKAFEKCMFKEIISNEFIQKIKRMTDHVYKINVDTQSSVRYSNTPKITNEQAKQICATSFAFRCIVPICIHFTNNNSHFPKKKDYIGALNGIYSKIVDMIEENDVKFFLSLCRFVEYRCNKEYATNRGTWEQKKMLYGITKSLQIYELITEVITVKSTHKLDHNQSSVSFFDRIINNFSYNFRIENYTSKPYEIDNEESSNDNDDFLSHAEQLEMSHYYIDESNEIISNVNKAFVMKALREKFRFKVSDEEYDFYYKNLKCNEVTYMLLNYFYSNDFNNDYTIRTLNREDTIWLIIWMKKWLQLHDLNIISQFATAQIYGKFKDNVIKNSKFREAIMATDAWNSIISEEFKYIKELYGNFDIILKQFSILLNSEFIILDPNPEINGTRCNEADQTTLIDEIRMFLCIIFQQR